MQKELRLSELEKRIILNYRMADEVGKAGVFRFLSMDKDFEKRKFKIIEQRDDSRLI